MKILVTGGCGFVGSHLVDKLVRSGHDVCAFDILEPQVHRGTKPPYLNAHARYIFKDIRDRSALKKAMRDRAVVFHYASQVGVAQSMYEIDKYVSHNLSGTGVLLDVLVNEPNSVKKLIVASSMTIYGEGAYRCTAACGVVYPGLRPESQLRRHRWEMLCPECGKAAVPVPTPECKPLFPSSVYAATKRGQEELCLSVGDRYRLPTVALRYFNIYGPRQSLNNPYTGVAAIFLSRIKNGVLPVIYEDGNQSRDFIHVSDVVDANVRAMTNKAADYQVFNVGTGIPHSVNDVAKSICSAYGRSFSPGKGNAAYRNGDIRHCHADISKIRQALGFAPKVTFTNGLRDLISWSREQQCRDRTAKVQAELQKRGLST